MSGRQEIKVFEYDEKGTHIETFKNMTICRERHFPEIKGKKGDKCSKCGMELTEPVAK